MIVNLIYQKALHLLFENIDLFFKLRFGVDFEVFYESRRSE